jgi:uncharacterized membrane protein YphA (DoxX/SURF4 family)
MTSTAAAPQSLRARALVPGAPLQRWLTTLARLVLGTVMLVAGALKVASPDDAVRAVQAYRLLPYAATHPVGYGLPLLEIVVGLLLILGLGTRVAAVLTGVLMVVYIAAIISVWVRGLSIDCGCFGGGGTITPQGRATRYSTEIARDLLFLGLASWIAVYPASRWALDRIHAEPDNDAIAGDLDDDEDLMDQGEEADDAEDGEEPEVAAGLAHDTHGAGDGAAPLTDEREMTDAMHDEEYRP